ncbi:LytR/AlgR family response regulator transcription factor [Larkinella rosea]|uniref:DNA-binding response regulator n=1 Tax=Larkinella rosea TaxID=2025312 RepID=A0A3P1BHC5_9BACT|nr:LytTR family DNA-binding domain-containing protein [Larkinella rosea]RRB00024.1 DNA-binding response regulator [Larkinella rosea]
MNQRQCLIVEDSAAAVAVLEEYMSRVPFFLPPDVCKSVAEAMVLLQTKKYDLIFLDMHLPDLMGLELLRGFPEPLPVIVTSAHPDFAVDSFDLNVADYLVKPFTLIRFMKAVNRALNVRCASVDPLDPPYTFLKAGHTVQRFDYNDIDYLQAYGVYCKIVNQQKVTAVNETISSLEAILPSQLFLRIHKSYIVNLAKITSYSFRQITLGTTQIPIGAAYRDNFQGFLTSLGNR